MYALDTLRARVNWTRSWLTTHRAETIEDDFQIIVHSDAQSRSGDVISLSSYDPATSCSESGYTSRTSAGLDSDHPRPHGPATDTESCSRTVFSNDRHDWNECAVCNPSYNVDTTEHPHEDHLAYATAGRPYENTFKDLRSASRARKRDLKHRQKYYNHRHIKRGQLNQSHLDTLGEGRLIFQSKLPHEAEVVIMNKKLLFTEAQKYPRPPTYHRRAHAKDRWPWTFSFTNRQKLRKYAHRNLEIALSERYDTWDVDERTKVLGYAHSLDTPAIYNDRWREFKRSDWCEVCNLHWSRCYALDVFEVDQIAQISFESDALVKGGWKLRWTEGGRDVDEIFGTNRGDAVLLHGKLDWDPRKDPEWFDDRDETDDDVMRALSSK
ncbi:hypothetical protein Slin15195_G095930 [Septoria linicola]|uniref:Uncharacterized protein n=1 Tax=Septoria linicola TaxID=215465 RepID=A0A9Q9AWI8_9PEZI|nr:hypothetical protein Slin14017_G059020 [Septoria linicola]USW56274.1 hypothetical protein Slin15195_G095930 [Septoria linicola]